jgi:hypothetical protein
LEKQLRRPGPGSAKSIPSRLGFVFAHRQSGKLRHGSEAKSSLFDTIAIE